MNKKINLAVAGALLVAASAANAGIIIPAGEWTMDINGNVNIYATGTSTDGANTVTGGLAATDEATSGEDTEYALGTGLLPAWLGFTGTTRQNDLDVSFTISIQPNTSNNGVTGDNAGDANGSGPLNRQAFITFGDKSWGTVKMGKDIGVFAQDAILNDMTLLGVGGGVDRSGTSTTVGGIGTGYLYAAWKGQMAYTTPNMNGFQATVAITNPNQLKNLAGGLAFKQERFGLEAKMSYAFTNGKIWASGASYKAQSSATVESDVSAIDLGAQFSVGNLGLVGYIYSGDGAGTTFLGANGFVAASGAERESDGGYVQATYVIPTGTKLGVAYGVSQLDLATGETNASLVEENNRWTIGAYHPLTKHLNLVAEYNAIESQSQAGLTNEADSVSLGAILFF
ncbi:MAG: porin [Proteobacteria bacterium]|nr:porin [Pseudomonadota bacterium]